LFQYHNIQFGEADAAFAEFDSILATDLVAAEPAYQQQPEYSQNDSQTSELEQEIPKPDRPNDDAIEVSPPEVEGEADSERPLRPNMFDDE